LSQPRRAKRLLAAVEVLDAEDLAVAEAEDLERGSTRTTGARGEGDEDAIVRLPQLGQLVLSVPVFALVTENLTGLLWRPSGGGLAPPEHAARDAFPVELGMHERDERLDIAALPAFVGLFELSDLLLCHPREVWQACAVPPPPSLRVARQRRPE
jgi:hypothetical protein